MNALAWWLSLWPFTVNASGRKAAAIVRTGLALYGSIPGNVTFKGKLLRTGGHPKAAIVAFATANFFRDFSRSALGIYMKHHLKRDALFVDVGANLGGYSWLARNLGARVHAFEPHPQLYAFLNENQHVFGQVHSQALGHQSGILPFFLSEQNPAGSSLVESEAGWEQSGYSTTVQVPVSTFDEVFEKEISTGQIFDLVKVDVEGHEEFTLLGMKNALQQQSVKAIWCEVRGAKSDRQANSFKRVCQLLEAAGFQAYYTNKGRAPFDAAAVNEEKLPQYFDLLFELNK